MDELIGLVAKLQKLRQEHPALAVRQSDGVIRNVTNQLSAQIAAIESTVQQQREEVAGAAVLASLPGFVDLTQPIDDTLPVSESPDGVIAVAVPGFRDCGNDGCHDQTVCGGCDDEDDEDDYEDDYDEDFGDYEPVPAATLVAEVAPADGREDIRAALDVILPSLAEQLPGYVVDEVTDAGALLSAPDDEGIPVNSLPNGSTVFAGVLPNSNVIVTLKIDGDTDPENPPLGLEEYNARALAYNGDEGVPEVEELRIILERQDDQELTTDEAQTIVPTAVRALSSLLGAHEVLQLVDGEFPAQKVAHLRPAGEGQLDRRVLTTRIAQFDGVLPFPGVGRVRAYARV